MLRLAASLKQFYIASIGSAVFLSALAELFYRPIYYSFVM